MHGENDILFGLSSFRLHRIPYQVLMLCPPIPPLWDNVRDPLLPKHPVIREIFGSPLHVLVTNRKDRRTAKNVRTHLVESRLPAGAIVDSVLGVQTCSPLFTLLTLARDLNTIELTMAMYEFCGNFSVFKPSEAIEELLKTPEAAELNRQPGAWKRVRSSAATASGKTSSLWMRPPLVSLDELHSALDEYPHFHGKKKFSEAANLVTGVTSSPFEVQLSMLLALPESMGGKGMPLFTNNARIALTKEARKMYPHSFIRADLLFEGNESRPDIDVECQGSIIHENEKQAISDSDRSTALASMNIEVLWITYEKISNASTFRSIAGLIARRIDYPLPELTGEARRRENELRRNLMIDWSTLGGRPM